MEHANVEPLQRPLQFERGVGPLRAERLANMGLVTVGDVLLHVPRRYEDRRSLASISNLEEGEESTIRARVIRVRSGRPRRGPFILTATLEDDTGTVEATWFNQKYLADVMREGCEVVITGKPRVYRDKLQLAPREYEIIASPPADDEESDKPALRARAALAAELSAGRIVPFYQLTEGISQRFMRMLAHHALFEADRASDSLPEAVRLKRSLVPLADALRAIHFPESDEARTLARGRLAFEELFVLQTGLALLRARTVREKAARYEVTPDIDRRIRKRLPFALTPAQDRVAAEIAADLGSGHPMNRLLQGDVGSGKTAVAVYAMLAVVASGAQAAVMAPTELLAAQHARTIEKYLAGSKVRMAVLTGSVDPASRRKALADLESGRAHLAVGTHALIEEGVRFKRLGLAVMDEQHKFGVLQRSLLKEKARNPHVLVMTATPIPRSLALAYFGDLDLSVIDELPPGRGGSTTTVVPESERIKTYRRIAQGMKASGRQAYVVCPRVEGAGPLDDFDLEDGPGEIRSAVDTRERLARGPFKGMEVGLLHGRMSAEEKSRAMDDFRSGRIRALVSTVVIEVGIDVPNATIMVVEHAERFGLSQLHQLRGRVVRGEGLGEIYLVADPKTEGAIERLRALEETSDGFRISEADFRLRGPGQIFGTRQSGLPELRFADILADFELLARAREDAREVVERDPDLASDGHAPLRRRVEEVFAGRLELGAVG